MTRFLFPLLAGLVVAAVWTPPIAAMTGPVVGERFAQCDRSPRVTCVVDGDTLWVRGTKIRLADINTPEISSPGCPREAQLGARATQRLIALLNSGPFVLEREARDADWFGRKLRVLKRS